MIRLAIIGGLVTVLVIGAGLDGPGMSIVNSRHNLSVSGPGGVRASSEPRVCIFCHSTHPQMATIEPLWNRQSPVEQYIIYTSGALDADAGQPTGSSKMCLSCHDGTIAVGKLLSEASPIAMGRGSGSGPARPWNLTTDLSDDHPISFRYDSSLAARDAKLVPPHQLPSQLKLDANMELQCTTCHDVHDDSYGNFLVMDNTGAAMCQSCHQINETSIAAHRDCRSCHQTHSAPSGPYLLVGENTTRACLTCHSGPHFAAADIAADLRKFTVHDTDSAVDLENPWPLNVNCADCHNPHTMDHGSGEAPYIHPNFGDVSGVTSSGSPIDAAEFEYEVCYKCHADQPATQPWITRQVVQNNTRLEFSTSAISSHPVEGPGRNSDVPSLVPDWTTADTMYCSDCHSSDNSAGAPQGVHGSQEMPLLKLPYDTTDGTSESQRAYALCYSCHERQSILSDETFPHQVHVQENRAPCAACHDAHGISLAQGTARNNSHLINFDLSIVDPNGSGELRYEDLGFRAGQCFLSCHGEAHTPRAYAN